VLYRSNQQARLVEEELTGLGIPYRVFGGQQFLDRKEVKDVAAYLRFVVNPWDEISLRRVINYPTRGIGLRSVQCIEEFATKERIPFVQAFARAAAIEEIPETARGSLASLAGIFEDARRTLDGSGALHGAAEELVRRIGLQAVLERDALGETQGQRRFENVQHLLRWIERYERKAPKSRKSLQDFLQRVTLNGEKGEDEAGPGVTLCTLHAAKGLEFGVVFLIGCVEGQLPHSRTTDPTANQIVAGDPEEERRLFYVGITRARDCLYLTAARRRKLRGQIVDVTPSRYIDDLPQQHIEAYDGPVDTIMSEEQFSSAIADLLASTRREPASSA
jgi:DNA helicase-2/ATP-dependent DNA helicase PcrA